MEELSCPAGGDEDYERLYSGYNGLKDENDKLKKEIEELKNQSLLKKSSSNIEEIIYKSNLIKKQRNFILIHFKNFIIFFIFSN